MNFLSLSKNRIQERKWYFKSAEMEITEINLHTLKSLSLIAFLLLVSLLFLAPIIIKDWRPTIYHISFVPSLLFFCVAVWIYDSLGKRSKITVNGLCIVFWILLFVFILLIDIFSNTSAQSCFMPLLCIALPAGFIVPIPLAYGIIGFFEIIYIFGTLNYKISPIGQYDVFCSVCAIGMSVAIDYFIMRMRIRDYQNFVKYESLSKHDALIAEIYNKQSGRNLIEKYINENNPEVSCSLFILDIDDFKSVNDTYGHYAGDRVLCYVGDVLKSVFRHSDIILRFGGDEFIVFAKGLKNEDLVSGKCSDIKDKVCAITEKNIGCPVTLSIGAVIAESCYVDGFKGLFCFADDALYEAKGSGKNRKVILHYEGGVWKKDRSGKDIYIKQ